MYRPFDRHLLRADLPKPSRRGGKGKAGGLLTWMAAEVFTEGRKRIRETIMEQREEWAKTELVEPALRKKAETAIAAVSGAEGEVEGEAKEVRQH